VVSATETLNLPMTFAAPPVDLFMGERHEIRAAMSSA
jgi:hypothetical protein